MRHFETLEELATLAGQHVATSDWIVVTQEAINQFAQATGDHQWIHIDVERAKTGPLFSDPVFDSAICCVGASYCGRAHGCQLRA